MAEQDDVYVGRTLLDGGRIQREDLIESLFDLALERRSGHGLARPLGVLLVSRGTLSEAELARLLAGRVRPPADDLTTSQSVDLAIGDVLVASGAATASQVNECLRIQRECKVPGHPSQRLGEILVERGYSTPAQIHRALAYLNKTVYSCKKCGMRFNVLGAIPGQAYACRGCGGELVPGAGGSVAVDGTNPKMPAVRPAQVLRPPETVPAQKMPSMPPEAQAAIDRAVKVYLKQKTLVRRSILHDAERFQIELSRYGLWVSFLDIVMRFGGLTWQQAEKIRKTDFEAIIRSDAWKQQAVPGYRVLGKIASGGFATIFAAEQVFGGRKVALKVMHADRAREPLSAARFKHEAALMMRFDHPHIVRAFDFAEEGPLRYLAMELVEGDSLDRYVGEARGLTSRRALSIAMQVADALRYMQTEGYIHRDVKPQNVLVDRDGKAKLCDLGFAQEMKVRPTGTSATTVGTAVYMSPEQARGELDLKVGTDIYALGLTFYFMLTAQEPFAGESSSEVMADRFAAGVAGPDLAALQAPEAIVALVRRMLDPVRERRFGSYPDLLVAMQEAGEELGGAGKGMA